MGSKGEEKMMKRDLVIKNRLGLIIFSVLLMIFTSVTLYAGEKRFVFSDLTATDKKTGLMWTRDANIAKKDMTWKDAFKFIEKLNKQKYAGYSDWRLPTKGELKTLVASTKSQGRDLVPSEVFTEIGFRNVQEHEYWSSSTDACCPTLAFYVDIDNDFAFTIGVDRALDVWPVRGGK